MKAVLPWLRVNKDLWVRPYYNIAFDNKLENEAAYVTFYSNSWSYLIDEDTSLEGDGFKKLKLAKQACDKKLTELGYRFLDSKFAALV